MLQFTTRDGRTFKIWWRYQIDEATGQHNITDCYVGARPAPNKSFVPVYEGRVCRHSTDPDCKETARKGSLVKALSGLAKPDRERAWDAYFERGVK